MPERVNVQIDFVEGVDQRTDARHVMPGKLSSIYNGTYEKAGSLRKRRGFTALSRNILGGGSLSSAMRIAAFASDLVLTDGSSLYSYSPAASKWVYRDQVPQVTATRSTVSQAATEVVSPDVAYGNGYLVFAWLENVDTSVAKGDVRVSVVDAASGTQVLSSVLVNSGFSQTARFPRVVVIGTTAIVMHGTGSSTILGYTIDLTSPTSVSSPTTLVSDYSTNGLSANYDAHALSDRFALVYQNTATGASAKVNVKTFNTALSSLASAALAETGSTDALNPSRFKFAVHGTTGERIWILMWIFTSSSTLDVKATALNPSTLAVTTASFAVDSISSLEGGNIGIVRLSSTEAMAVYGLYSGTTTGYSTKWKRISSSGTVTGIASTLRRHVLKSRPFVVDSRCYALVSYGPFPDIGSKSSTMFLLDLNLMTAVSSDTVGRPVATIAPRRSLGQPTWGFGHHTSAAVSTSSTSYTVAALVRKSADGKVGVDRTVFDFANTERFMMAELGGSLHLSGGVPCIYDGGRVIESAPLLAPEAPDTFSQAAGAGSMTAGTRSWCITYARYDLQGQIQRSAPSTSVELVVNANLSVVTFKVPPLTMTLLQDTESGFKPEWQIEIWRTLAGGTTFFKVPDQYLTYGGSSKPAPVLNDVTTTTITVNDSASDGNLAGQPFLYTTGNVLENRCPPSATILVVHKDRAFLAGTDDPKNIWFSQPYVFGEAPGFHDNLTITVEDGGAVTALASLDAHLIVFKRDRCFFIDGDGPGTSGGAGFSTPQRISVDLGCVGQSSVAVVPEGVVFQSTAGIYVLNRSLQVSYLSGPVEDTLAANPVITSAVVHESQFQIRFTCRPSASSSTGVVLVFDYLSRQWSVHTYYDATAAQASTAIASACNHGGAYKWVAPNGTVYVESSTEYTDASTWIGFSFETAWLKVGGLQGWQRAWAMQLLAERFSAHDLLVEVAVDYGAYGTPKRWRNVDIATMTLEQVRTAIVKQKCSAIRFRISDAAPTDANGSPTAIGTGQGFAATGLMLEAAVLGNKGRRLPAAQRK